MVNNLKSRKLGYVALIGIARNANMVKSEDND